MSATREEETVAQEACDLLDGAAVAGVITMLRMRWRETPPDAPMGIVVFDLTAIHPQAIFERLYPLEAAAARERRAPSAVVAILAKAMGEFFLLASGHDDWDDLAKAQGKGDMVIVLAKSGSCGICLPSEAN